ncbi:hypothetical protein TNCV_4845711 [Trichonephila clavipes]|uniref:Uncharacterized protein n=1 Tax=Trichonephila clavipes TaxID=2585209 RepID=A0A8X7BN33_TRICX|nr:hypothetical protein TNCV_4845711 [Trichonephila clavipes]
MKVSSTFSPKEDSTRITLVNFGSSLKKHSPYSPILVECLTNVFGSQESVFSIGCSQGDTSDWTPGVQTSLYKKSLDCLSGNSSSRRSGKVTRKLRSHCLPMSLYA